MRRSLIAALVACLLAACGGGDDESKRTTTTPKETTTTAPPPAAFLTGLPQPSEDKQRRPALIVKIDNAPQARPQAGLDAADVVYEEMVEGGVVRFLAVFHSRDAASVGPVRSVRPVDPDIVTPLRGLFAYSGGAPQFVRLIKRAPVTLVGYDELTKAYTKRNDRPGPHNLFTSTAALYKGAKDDVLPPPPLFTFLPSGQPFGVAGGAPLTHLTVQMGGQTKAEWVWDPATSVWRRTTNGTQHTVEDGAQIGFTNVIIQFVRYSNTSSRDPAGFPVPTAEVTGAGDAWVLSNGRLVKGRWAKANAAAITEYKDGAGLPIAMTPGTTWIGLAPIGAATSVK
ncbi:MAG TPA: DUF3048 domain-containing protein [Acidimicrobiales bacterium]|nr:DUF3048 domain-containing protein [Acidimicrobiales bacterium]